MKEIVISYIPVLHQGYIDFLSQENLPVFLVGKSILERLAEDKPYYGREIRMVDPEKMRIVIEGLDIVPSAEVLSLEAAAKFNDTSVKVIAPDEDVSQDVCEKIIKRATVEYRDIFLRWNKNITEKEHEVLVDQEISRKDFDREVMKKAFEEASESSDWWRQVGSVLIKDGEVILQAHNQHLPSEHSPYSLGDPRNNYDAGERIDLTTAVHSEANAIAQAARQGISLDKAIIYVTTFPCPSCAKLIAQSGIQTVYFSKGYSLLDAEKIFEAFDINVIRVVDE